MRGATRLYPAEVFVHHGIGAARRRLAADADDRVAASLRVCRCRPAAWKRVKERKGLTSCRSRPTGVWRGSGRNVTRQTKHSCKDEAETGNSCNRNKLQQRKEPESTRSSQASQAPCSASQPPSDTASGVLSGRNPADSQRSAASAGETPLKSIERTRVTSCSDRITGL